MRVHQLPMNPRPGVVIQCRECGETFSAMRADYWSPSPDAKLEHCDQPMRLVQRLTIHRRITPARADMPVRL